MNMPTLYDYMLDPPDDEEEDDLDDRDDDFIEPEPDYDRPMGRRVEHGRTIYEEDFIYDPLRGDY